MPIAEINNASPLNDIIFELARITYASMIKYKNKDYFKTFHTLINEKEIEKINDEGEAEKISVNINLLLDEASRILSGKDGSLEKAKKSLRTFIRYTRDIHDHQYHLDNRIRQNALKKIFELEIENHFFKPAIWLHATATIKTMLETPSTDLNESDFKKNLKTVIQAARSNFWIRLLSTFGFRTKFEKELATLLVADISRKKSSTLLFNEAFMNNSEQIIINGESQQQEIEKNNTIAEQIEDINDINVKNKTINNSFEKIKAKKLNNSESDLMLIMKELEDNYRFEEAAEQISTLDKKNKKRVLDAYLDYWLKDGNYLSNEKSFFDKKSDICYDAANFSIN